ncbi:DUF4870 domain-containing protein [Angustibacter sp. Root456]|uniref:DUF4870 domain-containing protein n=1 Tax=Angustibacter sp. Root456 TaxID=1736539 RepID=UPI0009EC4109|nr:DUF4870 domain-containing protein [Angustibacter sp. Root456]
MSQPYPPPHPPYAARPPMSPSDERTWAMLAHLAPFAGSIVGLPVVGPLVVYLMYKDRSAFVRRHAAASLNFQIMLLIVSVLGFVVAVPLAVLTLGIGLFAFVLAAVVVAVAAIVLQVVAALAANRGQDYQYPLTPTLVS